MPHFLSRQYQVGWNTNQNQMKNIPPFYKFLKLLQVCFQVLKVLLIKMCKMSHQIFYFFCFVLAFTSGDIISHKPLERHTKLP